MSQPPRGLRWLPYYEPRRTPTGNKVKLAITATRYHDASDRQTGDTVRDAFAQSRSGVVPAQLEGVPVTCKDHRSYPEDHSQYHGEADHEHRSPSHPHNLGGCTPQHALLT